MIQITDKKMCCGCSTCVAACPQNCIEMQADREGFIYPVVDSMRCVKCGICESVCPVLQVKKEIPFEQTAYIVQNKDATVLRESTAGGAFTAIAKYVLRRGGIVFGVALATDFSAQHIGVTQESELSRLRGSKYIQSEVKGDVYRQVKSFLEQGRFVCFSGTPCQIEGLKNYLGRDFEQLITVDVVCRAVPSPMIFQKYLEYQQDRFDETVTAVCFRDKHYGYKYSTMNITTNRNQGKYHHGVESDPWLRAYFSDICDRPSCYECRFRKQFRVSDFTIWDCFHVRRFSKELDDDRGATRVLVHTEKGERIFDEIKENFRCIQSTPETLVSGAREMKSSVAIPARRTAFFDDAMQMNGSQLFHKYFPDTIRVVAEHCFRTVCYRIGIYGAVKNLYMRIKHKY